MPNGLDSILSPPSEEEHEEEKPTSPIITPPSHPSSPLEPPSLPRLRTLLHVRTQLQRCISQFNLALTIPFPPSLLSPANPIVSSTDAEAQEAKGQAALARIKQEIFDLLADREGRGGGVERARERVRELREVVGVWKGTGEERARGRWVEGLEGMVDEERRERRVPAAQGQGRREGSAVRGFVGVEPEVRSGTPGFLRRLRDEIYMD